MPRPPLSISSLSLSIKGNSRGRRQRRKEGRKEKGEGESTTRRLARGFAQSENLQEEDELPLQCGFRYLHRPATYLRDCSSLLPSSAPHVSLTLRLSLSLSLTPPGQPLCMHAFSSTSCGKLLIRASFPRSSQILYSIRCSIKMICDGHHIPMHALLLIQIRELTAPPADGGVTEPVSVYLTGKVREGKG